MRQTILVIGGAGYIGSHTAYLLQQSGYHVIILDALLHNQTFTHPWATLIEGDYGNGQLLHTLFIQYQIDAVIHFAAHIEVGESVQEPLKFYANNVAHTIQLLQIMHIYACNVIVFSSSCAVYGNPHYTPIDELHPKSPISPYGQTKLMCETIFHDCAAASGLKYVALRYFNAAGGSPEIGLHEHHEPETHLIPLLIRAAYAQTPFYIFGTDHATPDGSCIRDFLHVQDIADAHLKALSYLQDGGTSTAFNLGTGVGTSVLEMIQAVHAVTGMPVPYSIHPKRPGDPAQLVANASKAHRVLGWTAQHTNILQIIADAVPTEVIPPGNLIQKGMYQGLA